MLSGDHYQDLSRKGMTFSPHTIPIIIIIFITIIIKINRIINLFSDQIAFIWKQKIGLNVGYPIVGL